MSKARKRPDAARFIVLTGLSGSGKSQAIRALEDLGYYCVDNLPVSLLPVMAELSQSQGAEHDRVAVVMDIREPRFVSDFPRVYRKLKTSAHLDATLIFLEAGHQIPVIVQVADDGFTDRANILGVGLERELPFEVVRQR